MFAMKFLPVQLLAFVLPSVVLLVNYREAELSDLCKPVLHT